MPVGIIDDDTVGDGLHDILTLIDRKSTRLNSSHSQISYAVFCLKKKNISRDRRSEHHETLGGKVHCSAPPSVSSAFSAYHVEHAADFRCRSSSCNAPRRSDPGRT